MAWAFLRFPSKVELDLVLDCVAHDVASRDLDLFTMQIMEMLAHSFMSTLVVDIANMSQMSSYVIIIDLKGHGVSHNFLDTKCDRTMDSP